MKNRYHVTWCSIPTMIHDNTLIIIHLYLCRYVTFVNAKLIHPILILFQTIVLNVVDVNIVREKMFRPTSLMSSSGVHLLADVHILISTSSSLYIGRFKINKPFLDRVNDRSKVTFAISYQLFSYQAYQTYHLCKRK